MAGDPASRPDAHSSPDRPHTVLFVCLGNICRSPLAEALLKQRLAERGLAARYRVHSAGIIARQGQIPPPDAVRAAAEQGVDITKHAATPLTPQLLTEADLVVAMDRSNVEHILNLVPGLVPRLRLLKQYEPGARGFDIPDPMGYPIEIFRDSYRQIGAGIDGLVGALERAPGGDGQSPGAAPL